ncbi:MAG: hypothetical protein AMJ75_12210 [Phycisphaerae bacterium SM1_79]|nr:MAG: hypothetical protein AMJ75_12210 [Phycisphaerae bacterium SM1_79]
MRVHNYIACEGILGIQTNAKRIGWSFGYPHEPVSENEISKCRLVVRFIVDSLKGEAAKLGDLERYHYWLGQPGRDEMFYQRAFLGRSKLRLLVRGLRSERPEIRVNENYLRFIRFRFNNLHSPGYNLTDLVCALLLQRGLCVLHCSGFSVGDATVAVMAAPNTGKTLTTMQAVSHYKGSFISEDIGITDGQRLFACPWTSTFRYYDELNMSRLTAMRMKLMKVLPVVELIPSPGRRELIDAYIDGSRIDRSNRVTHVVTLARRRGGVELIDDKRALQIVLNLNRYEFYYRKSPMLTAYSYFNPELDLDALAEKEKAILTGLISQSRCLLVQSKNPADYAKLIMDEIR